jgi:hypothetical protein
MPRRDLVQAGVWSWLEAGNSGEPVLMIGPVEVLSGHLVQDGAALLKLAADLRTLAHKVAGRTGWPGRGEGPSPEGH